jgi:hypothetical protein
MLPKAVDLDGATLLPGSPGMRPTVPGAVVPAGAESEASPTPRWSLGPMHRSRLMNGTYP